MSKTINNLNKSLEGTLDLSNYSKEGHKHDEDYAPISHGTHLELGVEAGNAFRGDYGNTAYTHSQAAHAPSNAQKNSDITKTEIENKLTGNIASHTHNYASPSDINAISNSIGDLLSLQTNNKNNLVEAVNELFQEVDSGKTLVANAIDDEAIDKNSTFAAMGEAVSNLKSQSNNDAELYRILSSKDIDINENYNIDDLMFLLERAKISVNDIKQVAGYQSMFVLKKDGSLWACGYNSNGQLGLGDKTDRTTLVQVTTNINNDVSSIVCGYDSVIALKKDGTLWGCGYNCYGFFGIGNNTSSTSTFIQIASGMNNIKKVFCGHGHCFIVKTDNTVWACGRNDKGQLGLGDTTNRTTFTQVTANISDIRQLECGDDFTFIVKKDGSLWACGNGNAGQLGLNIGGTSTSYKTTFTQVTEYINYNVVKVVALSQSSYILKNDGTVWSSGNNSYGQLGIGTTSSGGTQSTKIFTRALYIDANGVEDIISSNIDSRHILVRKRDGSLWGCGYNFAGQLGLGDKTNRSSFTKITTNVSDVYKVFSTYCQTFIVKNDGTLWVCGLNYNGQLGLGTSGSDANVTTFTKVSF